MSPFLSGTNPAEVMIVLKAASAMPASPHALWMFGPNGPADGRYYPDVDGTISDDFGSPTMRNLGVPSQPLTQYHLYNVSSEFGNWTARVGSDIQLSDNQNKCAWNYFFYLGYNGFYSYDPDFFDDPGYYLDPYNSEVYGWDGAYFDGDIAEIMVFDRTLTDDERSATRTYLIQKYALQQAIPDVPTGLSAKALSASQVSLSWSGSLSNLGAQFIIERSTDGVTFNVVEDISGSFSWIDSGLAAATQYYYRLKASNYGGDSGYSSVVSVSTLAGGTDLPLGDMMLWLKADAGHSAGQVGRWQDQSTNGNSFTYNGGAGGMPEAVEDVINGWPVIRFNANADQFLSRPAFLSGTSPAEVFVVLRVASDTPDASRSLWRFGACLASGARDYPSMDGTVADDFGSSNLMSMGNAPISLSQFHIYNVVSQAGEWTARFNGVVRYTTTNNSVAWAPTFYLGTDGDYFDGDIAEVILFDRALSGDERNTVETYLNQKYSFVVSAPGTPAGVSATALCASQICVNWNENLGDFVTRFVVERSTNGISFAPIALVEGACVYIDTELSPATQYFYQVQAVNYAGNSSYSPIVSATTAAACSDVPLGDMALWLRADSLGLLTNGAGVASWPDWSGFNNDATQPNISLQPVLIVSDVNGQPAVRFDGTNDFLSLPNFLSSASEGELFIVWKAASANPGVSRGGLLLGPTGSQYPAADGSIIEDFGTATPVDIPKPLQPLNQFNLYEVSANENSWMARLNGTTLYASNNTGFAASSLPLIGQSGFPFAGDIAEIIVFTRVLSDDERQVVATYLNARYAFVSAITQPVQLSVGTNSSGSATLSWTSGITNAAGFVIQRAVGTNGNFVTIAVLPRGDETGFTDSTPSSGLPYVYRIEVMNMTGATTATIGVAIPGASPGLPEYPPADDPIGNNDAINLRLYIPIR